MSTQHHYIQREESLKASTSQIETWQGRHYDPKKGWISPDL